MCSNIICHIYTRPLFLRRAQKASPEPPLTKSIRCALMPLAVMPQCRRFRCVRVRLIFNISASSWQNATVQGRLDSHLNIYTPWTQVHRSSAPSLPHRQLCAKLMSTTVLFDCEAVAKAWSWNALGAIHFWCLLKKHKFQCMDLKVLGPKRGCFHPTFLVMHYTAPNQNYRIPGLLV